MTTILANQSTNLETLSSTLLSTLDEQIFFSHLCQFMKAQLNVDRSKVFVVNENNSVMQVSENGAVCENGAELENGVGPAGHVIRTRKPYFSNNVARDPLYHQEAKEGVKAELSIPVSHEGIVIATLHLQVVDGEKEFSREDMTEALTILKELQRPLANMKMYLAAKQLNASLLKKIEIKEEELATKGTVVTKTNNSFKVEEKEIIGKSEAMGGLLRLADKISMSDINVLIQGQRGTGREMIAKRIHCRSERGENSFLVVDCSVMTEEALERELFGEEIGTFDETITRQGLLEIANGGSIFISNIDSIGINLQAKIYKCINDKVAKRVGGQMPFAADVRIFAASRNNLETLVSEGRFREELFFVLNTLTLNVPCLKDRKEDIAELATYFLNLNRSIEEQKALSPDAVNALTTYSWPGNVRELQNVIERAFILSDGMVVERTNLADCVNEEEVIEEDATEDENYRFSEMTLDELEKRHICLTLDQLSGNKTKTAKVLGITVKTLYNKLHSYGMIAAKEA